MMNNSNGLFILKFFTSFENLFFNSFNAKLKIKLEYPEPKFANSCSFV